MVTITLPKTEVQFILEANRDIKLTIEIDQSLTPH